MPEQKIAPKTAPTRRPPSPYRRVRRAFSKPALKRICENHELQFAEQYPDLDTFIVEERDTDNFYFYADRGSDILFLAHLDTVVSHEERMCDFAETALGTVVHSGSLDDRLGAYIGLELLPKLGLNFDILLLVGEEKGKSTAEFFVPPEGKEYKWGIEFDRTGTDVVMYRYQDFETSKLVRDSGATVGNGSFSDIAELYRLGVKMFNWGQGMKDYHSVRGYAYLEDTFKMVTYFLNFHAANKDTVLVHDPKAGWGGGKGRGSGGSDLYGGHYGGGSYGGGSHYGSGSSTTKDWWERDDDKIVIGGQEYEGYVDWWEANHPNEEMVL